MEKEYHSGKNRLAGVLACLLACAAVTLLMMRDLPIGLAADFIPKAEEEALEQREADMEDTAVKVPREDVSDETVSDEAVSDEAVSDEAVSDEAVSDEAVSDEEVTGPVQVGSKSYPNDVRILTVSSREVTAGELCALLNEFPLLEEVKITGDVYSTAEKVALREEWENIHFHWPVTILGRVTSSEAAKISFAGTPLTEEDLQEIRDKLPEFHRLECIDLRDCGFSAERLHRLDLELGDTDVAFEFPIYGVTVCSTDEEIDLSGNIVLDKGAEVEGKLDWMPNLQKVVMVDCQIKNEDMDALNRRHPDVRFVWMVQVREVGIRTDSTYYINHWASGARQCDYDVGVDAIKYCPDLIALDFGHANIRNLDFLDVMPNIKYLIVADNWISDIEKIGTLKELTYLELFRNVMTDISPLVNCTKLTDLNICYIAAQGDNVYETLRQMKSLRRLWCSGTFMSEEQLASLREELPDCEIYAVDTENSTGSTWRFSESYYEMRDALHMFYMDGDGEVVRRLTPEELEQIHIQYWGY